MIQQKDSILAVSLESTKKYMAYGLYDGSRLAITHCVPLKTKKTKGLKTVTWQETARKEIEAKAKQGFIVLVEDMTQNFCVGDSSPFSFEEILNGRTMLFHALDWYFAMLDTGNIIADNEVQPFLIRGGAEGQKIEKTQDEKGRTVYKVDWAGINGGTKAVLMCVVGAMMQPLSERYLSAMYGEIQEEIDSNGQAERIWGRITHGVDRDRVKQWDSYYSD